MRRQLYRLVALGVWLAVTGTAFAQDVQKKNRLPAGLDLVPIYTATGTPVVYSSTIPKTRTEDRQPTKAGTVQDFILDAKKGTLEYIAVAAAKKARAVPIHKVSWDRAAKRWVMRIEPAEFKALPALPHKDLAPEIVAAGKFCYASKLATAPVLARQKKSCGRAVDLWIERRTRSAAFVILRVQGVRTPIPFDAIAIETKGQVVDDPKILLDLPAARLAKAPRIGTKKAETLQSLKFRLKVYRFFDVAHPAYEVWGAKPPIR